MVATQMVSIQEPLVQQLDVETNQKHTKKKPNFMSANGKYKSLIVILGISFGVIIGLSFLNASFNQNRPASAIETLQLSRESRIINPLPENYHPRSTVIVGIGRKNGTFGSCSGSIIDEFAILTAAHCFFKTFSWEDAPNEKDLEDISSVTIYVGVNEKDLLKRYSSIGSFYLYEEPLNGEQKIKINQTDLTINKAESYKIINLNPHWSKASLNNKSHNPDLIWGDIAVINLKPMNKSINFEKTGTVPVSLFAPGYHTPIPQEKEDIKEWSYEGRLSKVVGYGYTNTDFTKRGLGTNNFVTLGERACEPHLEELIGRARDHGFISKSDKKVSKLNGIFCAKGLVKPLASNVGVQNQNYFFLNLGNSEEFLLNSYKIVPTQICSADSGGPIFSEIETIAANITDNNLYQISKNVQLGLTVLSDHYCDQNFNGFLEVRPYLSWMEQVLPETIFKRIDGRIVPSKEDVDTFNKYKKTVLEWRNVK